VAIEREDIAAVAEVANGEDEEASEGRGGAEAEDLDETERLAEDHGEPKSHLRRWS
jgi:hypothetical protein